MCFIHSQATDPYLPQVCPVIQEKKIKKIGHGHVGMNATLEVKVFVRPDHFKKKKTTSLLITCTEGTNSDFPL